MVCFTCNNCGDSLQKPKVAKHYQFSCRSAPFLTCVDCHKDFRGEEYVAHTKCITESERYGGRDYVPKTGANKGEKKQQAWINVVQNTLTNSQNLSVPERNLLNSISKHENIPRKKAKFLNFIKNLSHNRVNMTVVESVWEKMEKAFKDASSDDTKDKNTNTGENQNDCIGQANVESEIKENKEKDAKKKQSKKRQLKADENDNEQPANKKKVKETNGTQANDDESITNGANVFSWKNKILEIVTAKGEISLKKLKKKVLAQYLTDFPSENAEKATSKFEKKLKKVSGIIVEDDKVKLSS